MISAFGQPQTTRDIVFQVQVRHNAKRTPTGSENHEEANFRQRSSSRPRATTHELFKSTYTRHMEKTTAITRLQNYADTLREMGTTGADEVTKFNELVRIELQGE